MNTLHTSILGESKNGSKNKPLILFEGKNTAKDLERLKKAVRIWKTKDVYERQLRELFEITHPSLAVDAQSYAIAGARQEKFIKERRVKKGYFAGNWIYFPWSGVLTHTVNEYEYFLLRTNRNRNLITDKEQKILAKKTIGIVGLSIGSHAALTLVSSGIGKTIKLAEFDALESTNLNRIAARIDQIGEPKISITAKRIYEINPYADLKLFSEGLTEAELKNFVGKPKPDIIIELMDNFEMKIKLRIAARAYGVPVLSFANIGDRVLMDIERFDLSKKLPLFNGLAGKTPEEILRHPDISNADKHRYAVELVGKKNIPQEALESVREIGKSLAGRPQLISTVAVSSGLIAYFTRQILLKKSASGGRKLLRFDALL